MTLRVLIGTAYFESHRGGIEIVAGRLARELRQHGCEITWLASNATPPPDGEAGCGGALPVAAWNITERRLGIPMPLPGPAGLAAIWRAVRLADVLHLHDGLYLTNVVAMLAARWHRRPVVLTQHIAAVPYSNPLLRGLMGAANALIARPMLRAADQVVFISKAVATYFGDVATKAPPRLVFNGVDTGLFSLPAPGFDRRAIRVALGLPAEARVVLFVGRFVEKKGLHLIERLARQRPDLVFALAGWGPIDPGGWGLANVRVIRGLQGPSLAPLYQASEVFLLPSIGEGLPLVLQEAMACGLPVLCGKETLAADPDAATLIEGVDVEGADPDALARAMSIRLDGMLAATSGPDGTASAAARHAYVRSRYSWSEAAAAYAAIIRGLVTPHLGHTASPAPQVPQNARRP